jgi:hypothetical protein
LVVGRANGRTCNVTTEEDISTAIDAAGRSLGKLIGSHDDSRVLMGDPAKIQCLRWQVN